MKSQQRASIKHRKNKRQAATTCIAEQLSDGITADAEDNDNFHVVRRVSRESKTLATQTGDNEHQRSDQQEREIFARAVQLGTLWTRDELIQAQLADVDLQPVYNAKLLGGPKPAKEALRGLTVVARFYMTEWDRLCIENGVSRTTGWECLVA